MNRSGLLITLLMGCLTLLLWKPGQSPNLEPPWPAKIDGFSFSPLRDGESPGENRFPAIEDIDEDLALLAGDAHAVRTYTVAVTLAEIPRLAGTHGLNVALGAWISDDEQANENEIEQLIKVYQENHRNIVRVIVGNEALLRTERPWPQMIEHLRRVRTRCGRRSASPNPGTSG